MYNKLISENGKKAVVRAIELKGLKNSEKIIEVQEGVYSHTNTRGRLRYFEVISGGFNKYSKASKRYVKHKLHRVNSFYIIETDEFIKEER